MALDAAPLYFFSARLATFDGPVQLTKRRASNLKKKQPSTVSWPHITPTPEQLARAGFYYKPSLNAPDSVTCFLCERSLDGWDPDDKPVAEHLSHVPDCAWAICSGIETRGQDSSLIDEHPSDTKMADARRATFADWWPHEGKKGWKCKIQKMVEAGWSYDPMPEEDDCVRCFYCSLRLDGWEPKDDPWVEHQRRSPECQFFKLMVESQPPAPTSKRPAQRASRSSRSSRLSTQSMLGASFDPHTSNVSEGEDAEEGDTIISITGTKRKAPRVRKRASTVGKAARRPTRKASAAITQKPEPLSPPRQPSLDTSLLTVEDHQNKVIGAAGAIKTDNFLSVALEVSPAVASQSTAPPQKRTTKKKAAVKQAMQNISTVEPESELQSDVAPRVQPNSDKNPRHKKEVQEASIVLLSPQMQDNKRLSDAASSREKRGRKRTSDGIEKRDKPVTVLSDTFATSQRFQASVQRSGYKVQNFGAVIQASRVSNSPMQSAKQVRIQSNVKGTQFLDDPEEYDGSLKTILATLPAVKPATKVRQKKSAATDAVLSPGERPGHEIEKQLLVIVPAQVEMADDANSLQQSSDAENQPPSSRPSLAAGHPKSSQKTPRHSRPAVATPVATPSRPDAGKHGLRSSLPWEQVNLESVFVLSPSNNALGKAATTLQETLRSLSEAEKQMSVEDWILWNANSAEERLRSECERLINVFESEGVRALKVVEGIDCA